MHTLLAVYSASNSRRIIEVGALAGVIGALLLAGSALPFLKRIGLVLGGLLVAAGFALLIVAIHFGVNPFHAAK
jgi:hypothetical protein